MKNIALPILFMFLFFYARSQDAWTVIHPSPTVSNLIDAHFLSDNTGWVVGTNGTILHTDDGGQTWDLQHSDPDEALWGVFFIDELEGWACGWSKVYHTSNAGETWEIQSHPAIMGDLTDVYFINPDTGWIVGTYKIVLKTTNGGENWTKIMNNIYQDGSFFSVEFYDELHGCAVGEMMAAYPHKGFAMTTSDGGMTWTETTPVGCEWLSDVTYYNDMCVWACGLDCLYRSLDGGYTWFDELFSPKWFKDIHFFNMNDGMLLCNYEVWLTFDGGSNWDSLVYFGNTSNSYSAFTSWDDGKGVAVGYNASMAKTLDGCATWETLTQGIRIYFSQIGFFDPFNGFVIGIDMNDHYLIRTSDGGHTWEYDTLVEHGPFNRMHLEGQQCCLLNSDSLLMMKSLDAGQSWEMYPIPDSGDYYSNIFFVNENTGYISGYNGQLIKTINGGQSWTDLSLAGNHSLTKLYFADEENGWMIDYNEKIILHTVDGGLTWSQNQLGGALIYQPEDIFFHDAYTGFVNTDDGLLYKSTDGGESWELIYGFAIGSYSSIYFTSETEGWYLAGKIHHSTDGGQTWDDGEYFGLSSRAMFFLDEDKGWISGTKGLVVSYDGTVGTENDEIKSSNISLFPNPARNSLSIMLPDVSFGSASVKVFSADGRTVMMQTAAVNSGHIRLDVSSLDAGTYLMLVNRKHDQFMAKFVKQ